MLETGLLQAVFQTLYLESKGLDLVAGQVDPSLEIADFDPCRRQLVGLLL